MKFFIKDFSSKYDQIRSFQRIWSHLLKKSLMENFIFCAVIVAQNWNLGDWFLVRYQYILVFGNVNTFSSKWTKAVLDLEVIAEITTASK